jgi:hypothetical protein
MGLVGDDRNLDVFYELYHLTPLEGTVSYLSRYTILPLDYVVGFDHHVTRGAAAREDLTVFAAGGLAIGNVTLSTRNYSDIRFPRETVPPREVRPRGHGDRRRLPGRGHGPDPLPDPDRRGPPGTPHLPPSRSL